MCEQMSHPVLMESGGVSVPVVSCMSSLQKIGLRGELWVRDYFRGLGYDCEVHPNFNDPFDLLLESVLPLEVKTAYCYRQSNGGGTFRYRYFFNLRSLPVRLDFGLVLVCETLRGPYPFFVPAEWIVGRQSVSITSQPWRYTGYLSVCLFNPVYLFNCFPFVRKRLGQYEF